MALEIPERVGEPREKLADNVDAEIVPSTGPDVALKVAVPREKVPDRYIPVRVAFTLAEREVGPSVKAALTEAGFRLTFLCPLIFALPRDSVEENGFATRVPSGLVPLRRALPKMKLALTAEGVRVAFVFFPGINSRKSD